MASYPSARYRGVSTGDAFLAVLLLALMTILVGCGASASQPSGHTPSPTKKQLKGTITEFPLPTSHSAPAEIITGPDNNLWFVEGGSNKIGRITPSGTITDYPLPANSAFAGQYYGAGITTGPDGNLWFTEVFGNKIERITPSGTITEYPIPTSPSIPVAITTGPDGNLWFEEGGSNKIGRITPRGTITEFPVPTAHSPMGIPTGGFLRGPGGITTGPDGNLWFTELHSDNNKIGRITPGGITTEYAIPTSFSGPWGIITGPDGNLWFTENGANKIGRLM